MMYQLDGKFVAKENCGDELFGYLSEASKEMEKLPECNAYHVEKDSDSPDIIHVHEEWTDEAAHLNSLQLDVTQKLIENAKPIIKGMERE